jgi:hypothetical protein
MSSKGGKESRPKRSHGRKMNGRAFGAYDPNETEVFAEGVDLGEKDGVAVEILFGELHGQIPKLRDQQMKGRSEKGEGRGERNGLDVVVLVEALVCKGNKGKPVNEVRGWDAMVDRRGLTVILSVEGEEELPSFCIASVKAI